MRNHPTRILSVDDNFEVATALELKVRLAPDLFWAGHLDTADRLFETVSSTAVDVVLLDIDMPGLDAFEALQKLTGQFPDVRVIMLTGYPRDDYVDRAMDAGAWGFLSKSESPDAIMSAVREVALGNVQFGDEVARQFKLRRGEPVQG